jgi:hypothetical protein
MLRLQVLDACMLCVALTACAASQDTYRNDETGRLTVPPKRLLSNDGVAGLPALVCALVFKPRRALHGDGRR